MKTVFVCYESQDWDFVKMLVADLSRRNTSYWLDVKEVAKREVRDLEIQKAIQSCACFLMVISKNSIDSKQVMFELAYARMENKAIIPVLIDDCNIPRQLQQEDYIDFRNHYLNGLKKVLERFANREALSKDDNDNLSRLENIEVTTLLTENRMVSDSRNIHDQSKNIELRDTRVVGDVFIGEKHVKTDSPGSNFPAKPLIQIVTITIGLIGIGFPIWWFLNHSSKDVLGYLLPSLIVVLSILITLIGILAPDQLVKIILYALGFKKE